MLHGPGGRRLTYQRHPKPHRAAVDASDDLGRVACRLGVGERDKLGEAALACRWLGLALPGHRSARVIWAENDRLIPRTLRQRVRNSASLSCLSPRLRPIQTPTTRPTTMRSSKSTLEEEEEEEERAWPTSEPSRSDASRPMTNSMPPTHPGKIQATKRASRTPYQNTWLLTDPVAGACWPTAVRTNPPITRTSHVMVGKARPRNSLICSRTVPTPAITGLV